MHLLLDDFTIERTNTKSDLSQSRERTWIWYNVIMFGLAFTGLFSIGLFSVSFPLSLYFIALVFLGGGMNVSYWLVALTELYLERFLQGIPQLPTWMYFGLSIALNLYFLLFTAKEYSVL